MVGTDSKQLSIMERKMDYVILHGSWETVEAEVREHINAGWECKGGAQVIRIDKDTRFAQTMVRDVGQNLPTVEVLTYNPATKTSTTIAAVFHGFGCNYVDCGEFGPATYSTAIIEDDEGQLFNVPVGYVKFIAGTPHGPHTNDSVH